MGMGCKFDEAWRGTCKKGVVKGGEYCFEHSNIKCFICGEQATHTCPEALQLVCGVPLCEKENCKIRHHPKFYKFTASRWAEIYGVEVTKEMLATEGAIISHERFKSITERSAEPQPAASGPSFTIKCNKCGGEQTFVDHDNGNGKNILIYGDRDQDVTIRCKNKSCPTWVTIE